MSENWTEEEATLRDRLDALDPNPAQVARLQGIILTRAEREARPLLAEWLELVRVRPFAHGGLVLAATCALLITTPLGSLLWAALRAGPWQ